ncbi:histone deacetylase complex subunit SAP30 isoform X2 [Papio anubis]|uniref:histone deacetylase complex subunit SAP30 isoform X2 n=1 Tax=Papio anubis TaxID=9555 RepID=UPI0012ADDE1F|nr:histone deacetylase complex subunit SAP30 isoform X2 [Papio anubis]
MNGFTPDEMSRGGDAAAAVAAVVAAAAAAASAGNGTGAGAGAEVPGAGTVSVAGPPGAAGPGPGQLCCLREDGERCGRAAGNASFSKRIQKSISQKKVKIELDKSDTKQRGPPDRGPRVVFLQPGSSSGMEAPLFCCPSWCLAPGGANSSRLGESGGPSRSRKILFLSVFRLLRSGVRGKPSSPAAWQ